MDVSKYNVGEVKIALKVLRQLQHDCENERGKAPSAGMLVVMIKMLIDVFEKLLEVPVE